MNDRAYFMIDGSCLFSKINELWKNDSALRGKKLSLDLFSNTIRDVWYRYTGSTVRINFYFKKGDERLKSMLVIPVSTTPGAKSHMQIIECAETLKTVPQEQLDRLDPEYQDIFPRSEKGLDIRLVCDSLLLAARVYMNNIVLFVNDTDYLPFFNALQSLGLNVYLTNLNDYRINKELADLSDMFLTLKNYLPSIFI